MQWLHLNVLLLELLKIFKVLKCTNTFTMECKECLKSKELGRREGQERQRKSKTEFLVPRFVSWFFSFRVCLCIYVCPLYMAGKKRKGLVSGKTKRMRGCEGPLETGRAVLMKEGSESLERSSLSGSGELGTKSTVQWHHHCTQWNDFCVSQTQTLVESLQQNA